MLNMLEGTAQRAIRNLRTLGTGSDAAFLHRRTGDVLVGAGKLREALPELRTALRRDRRKGWERSQHRAHSRLHVLCTAWA